MANTHQFHLRDFVCVVIQSDGSTMCHRPRPEVPSIDSHHKLFNAILVETLVQIKGAYVEVPKLESVEGVGWLDANSVLVGGRHLGMRMSQTSTDPWTAGNHITYSERLISSE